jgi:hypothetical protein
MVVSRERERERENQRELNVLNEKDSTQKGTVVAELQERQEGKLTNLQLPCQVVPLTIIKTLKISHLEVGSVC